MCRERSTGYVRLGKVDLHFSRIIVNSMLKHVQYGFVRECSTIIFHLFRWKFVSFSFCRLPCRHVLLAGCFDRHRHGDAATKGRRDTGKRPTGRQHRHVHAHKSRTRSADGIYRSVPHNDRDRGNSSTSSSTRLFRPEGLEVELSLGFCTRSAGARVTSATPMDSRRATPPRNVSETRTRGTPITRIRNYTVKKHKRFVLRGKLDRARRS